jgi:NAD(P)-dependent dehydrogenase (short-subunit alcohol dehydrogenase family)
MLAKRNDRTKMLNLNGRVALVTGASSGMGRSSALALAAAGAAVLCTDITKEVNKAGYDDDLVSDTDDLIRNRGGQAAFAFCDVSVADQVEAAVATAS